MTRVGKEKLEIEILGRIEKAHILLGEEDCKL